MWAHTMHISFFSSILLDIHMNLEPQNIYSIEQLSIFNGEGGKPCYVSIRGTVYDVTSGLSFYGPGKMQVQ